MMRPMDGGEGTENSDMCGYTDGVYRSAGKNYPGSADDGLCDNYVSCSILG